MRKIVGTARTKHKFCILNIYRNRDELGEYHRLVQELKLSDREYFFRYTKLITTTLVPRSLLLTTALKPHSQGSFYLCMENRVHSGG